MSIDKGFDFETWICYELPWKLGLSPSKEVAMNIFFAKFADRARPLVNKPPLEFEKFFEDLKQVVEKVSNFRAPKGTKIATSIYEGEIDKFPNGRERHRLYNKKL